MRKLLQMLFMGVILTTQGCIGTLNTRFSSMYHQHDFVGAYPYAATEDDFSKTWDLISGHRSEYSWRFVYYFCLPSVPCDLLFDTVLLPADLVAWPCGYKKEYQ